MKKLVLIDAQALIHRCFHALPNLTTPQGEPIGAVYGTAVILLKMIKELAPDYLVACFDLPEPTFRHEKFLEYKAQRPKTPSELSSQIPKVKRLLEAFGIKYLEMAGFEADDLIGSLVEKFKKEEDLKIIIVTGDLDTLQLVEEEKVVVYTMKKGIQETIIYDEKMVKERFELSPSQLVDFKALKGDPSDNIPGIKGIGEKNAIEILKTFDNLENLYQILEKEDSSQNPLLKKIKPKILEALKEQKDQAFFSKYLASLRKDLPLDCQLEDLAFSGLKKEKIVPLFQEWRFESLLNRLGEKPHSSSQPTISFQQLREEQLKEFLESLSEGEEIVLFFEEEKLEIFSQGKLLVLSQIQNFPQLKSLLENPSILKFGYELKELYKYLALRNWSLKGIKGEAKIWQWLINSEIKEWTLEKIWQKIFKTPLPSQPKAVSLFLIKNWQEKKLKELGLEKLSEEIEMPLIPILAQMELKGIKLDLDYFEELKEKVDQEIKNLEEKIFGLIGKKFNLNSPKQLREFIFKELKIPSSGLKKTSKGSISTKEDQLKKIQSAHPLIPLILQHRELSKLKNTYLETLLKLADQNARVHTHYNQTGTATGRLSSDNPNLQNIPLQGEWAKALRKGFIPEKGYLFLAFDYSQIELRLTAHLSQDEKLLEIFQKDQDVHLLTAKEIFNLPLEKITPEMRRQAKTLNFGILYGMGARAFAEAANLSLKEAQKFIEEYYRDFQGVKKWQEEILKEAQEKGFVKTLTGRIRWVPDIVSFQRKYRQLAERVALNFPIQGLAADLIKKAMIAVEEALEKEKLKDRVHLLLQIHDELIFEVKEEVLSQAEKIIKEKMEGVFPLSVPLKVNSSWGKNLAELKD